MRVIIKDKIGTIGVVLGFLSLAIVLFQFFFGPVDDSSGSLLKSTTSKIYSLVRDQGRANGQADLLREDKNKLLSYSSIVLAFLAIVFGTVAYIRNDKKETAYAGISIGVITLLFHFMLIAIGIVIILTIIAIVLNN